MRRLAALALGTLVLLSCQDAPPVAPHAGPDAIAAGDAMAGAGAQSLSAVVDFGRPEVGSPFPPPEHDASYHAKDKLNPRTVVIAVGGTVTFRRAPVHLVAIYEPGTEPEDIDVTQLAPSPIPELPIITDDDGLVAWEELDPATFFQFAEFEHTFTAPGRYLVICRLMPHFAFANMYGWVIVK